MTYFWAMNMGSKNSEVIRCAYSEQAVTEQSPAESKAVKMCPARRPGRTHITRFTEETAGLRALGETRTSTLPLRMKLNPARQTILALVLSEPPILVHFMPTRAKTAPKKPRQTAEIIRPLHTWMYPGNPGKDIAWSNLPAEMLLQNSFSPAQLLSLELLSLSSLSPGNKTNYNSVHLHHPLHRHLQSSAPRKIYRAFELTLQK